jgi:phosphoribosylformylglycinamidine cyclo-ligase
MSHSAGAYAASGVDIDLKSKFISSLVHELKYRRRVNGPFLGAGHFTAAISFGKQLLTLSTDGVGSKLLLARKMNRWDTVGIDCVAMNVNDTICVGAEPIAIVDYVATPALEPDIAAELGRGLNTGAKRANVTVVGGEVAVLGSMMNELDLSASCLGVVERKKLVTGSRIRAGDEIVGIDSSGVHSNGFSLVRMILSERNIQLDEKFQSGKSLGDVLMTPTTIYVKPVLRCLSLGGITGMANITGGGMKNILRLKENVLFSITDLPRPHRIFTFLSENGNVPESEMFQTFNMGTGFVIVTGKGHGDEIVRCLRRNRLKAGVIGQVEKGHGVSLQEYGVHYDHY